MKFKTDENVHPDVSRALQELGYDVATVYDQGLRGRADELIWQVCRSEQRILLTFDLGFADLRTYLTLDSAGIIVLRLGSQARNHVVSVIRRLHVLLQAHSVTGRLWIVEEDDVRIRGGIDTPGAR